MKVFFFKNYQHIETNEITRIVSYSNDGIVSTQNGEKHHKDIFLKLYKLIDYVPDYWHWS